MPYPVGNAGFDAATIAAEQVKQRAYASAYAAYGGNPANYATYSAAMRAVDVQFFSSIVGAGQTFGVPTLAASEALMSIQQTGNT
jgi:hypothetical protein